MKNQLMLLSFLSAAAFVTGCDKEKFWTWLWGVPGALLSVPILVSVKVVCDRFPSLASVSELLGS